MSFEYEIPVGESDDDAHLYPGSLDQPDIAHRILSARSNRA